MTTQAVLVCSDHSAGPVPVRGDHSAGPVLVRDDHTPALLVLGVVASLLNTGNNHNNEDDHRFMTDT